MPTLTQVIVEKTTRLFCDHVHKLHGVPKVILSDIDARFINRFWISLHGLMWTRLAMSTAFHPQIDEQMKIIIRVIKEIL